MSGIVDVLRNFPLLSVALILTPLVGGVVGAYLGYDNLTSRLAGSDSRQELSFARRQSKRKLTDFQFRSRFCGGMSRRYRRMDKASMFCGEYCRSMTNCKTL